MATSSTLAPTTTPSTTATPTSPDSLTASCTTAVPGLYGNVPINACNSYYNFDPQFAPAVAVAFIFGLLTVAHLTLAIVYRKRYPWVLIMGALWETISFIAHSLGAHDQQNVGYATAWQLLFLLAPLWINAFVYMTFARTVYFSLPEQRVWVIKAQSMSKYFVWADVSNFLVQAVGGIMASPGAEPNIIQTGLHVYLAGMGIQMFFIAVFVCLMIVFHRRALELDAMAVDQHPGAESFAPKKRTVKPLLYALYGTLAAIFVRIIYRICEFAGGITLSNPIPFHEAYAYALDAFPMMVALLVLAIFHPGRYLQGPGSEFPSLTRAEKKAAKRVKKEEKANKKAMKKNKGRGYGYDQVDLTQMPPDYENIHPTSYSGGYDPGYSSASFVEGEREQEH